MKIDIEYDSIEEHDYLKPLIKEWSKRDFVCWIRPSPILRNLIQQERKKLKLLQEMEKRNKLNNNKEIEELKEK